MSEHTNCTIQREETTVDTPAHRPFKIAAINDGYLYFTESWRYRWELVDVDGSYLAGSTRYPIYTVAEARFSVVEALDALGLGDAALRIDSLSAVKAATDAHSDIPSPSVPHRPFQVTRKNYGRRFPDRAWYWSIVNDRAYPVGKSREFETEEECDASLARAVDVIYGSTEHLNELVERPERQAAGNRMRSRR